MQYGYECFCGDNRDYDRHNSTPGECTMKCAGNSRQYCGAGNRINIYPGTVIHSRYDIWLNNDKTRFTV